MYLKKYAYRRKVRPRISLEDNRRAIMERRIIDYRQIERFASRRSRYFEAD